MLTLDQIKKLLKDRRLSIIEEKTGIHRNTLALIRDGVTENPEYSTIEKLSEYFSQHA